MASLLPAFSLPLLLLLIFLPVAVHGVGVFRVQRKFAGNDNPPIDELRKHDAMRRSLLGKPEAIALPLGGNVSGTIDNVLGDDKTLPASANITFGCASRQKITERQQARLLTGVDGIIGFAHSNHSVISQLASPGKARKIFAHCLDTNEGGGIFAIGHVVKPKVRTTPLVPNINV